jgi:hypothetical protein
MIYFDIDEPYLGKASFINPDFDLVCEEIKRHVKIGRLYRVVKIASGAFRSKSYVFLSGEEVKLKTIDGKEVLEIVRVDVL